MTRNKGYSPCLICARSEEQINLLFSRSLDNKKIFIIIFAVLALWFFIRFVIGGPEDTWICRDGQWVKHGAPSASEPTEPCAEEPQAEKSVKLYYYNPELVLPEEIFQS